MISLECAKDLSFDSRRYLRFKKIKHRQKQERKMRYRVQTALPLAANMLGLSVISLAAETITSTRSEQPLVSRLVSSPMEKNVARPGRCLTRNRHSAHRPKDRSHPTADPHAESPSCTTTLAFGKRDPHNNQWH